MLFCFKMFGREHFLETWDRIEWGYERRVNGDVEVWAGRLHFASSRLTPSPIRG